MTITAAWRTALVGILVTTAALAWPPSGASGGWDSSRRFTEMLASNETRLMWQSTPWRGGFGSAPANGSQAQSNETACDGRPFLLMRTAIANGFCPARFTALNASCSCVDVDNKSVAIEFRVRVKAPGSTRAMPGSIDGDSVLSVSSIGSLNVPTTLHSLSIIGDSKQFASLALPIAQGKRWGGRAGQLSLLWNTDTTQLASVTIANVDLSNVTNSETLFPATVSNLSLSNCNIPGFNIGFIRPLGNLVALDLSSNNLAEPYERPQIERCVTGLCQLRSLNLTNNKFTTLPQTTSFYESLVELDLSGNPITNTTVSADIFSRLSELQFFRMSASATVECSTGSKQVAHDVELCVVDATSSQSSTITDSSSTSANKYLLYTVIGAGVVVVVLVLIIVRQRFSCGHDGKEYHHFPFSMGIGGGGADATAPMSNFDESFYNTGTATILNDPIIITRRIQQSDIKIATCLSTGGFGVVYSGVYRRRRRVAIKKIRPEYNTNNKMIETFLKEICLMATLRHARIVEFIGVAWDSPRDLCAVTELMEKGDVRDVLHHQRKKNRATLTWASGKKHTIALHVAEALAYLHSLERRVIHRDLKAKNVLLNAKLEAKLSDFGISRERQMEETHMTAAVGTSFWIAPEVLLGCQDYDERADIYSFGVVLCEIDTEDYPFWTQDNPDRGNKAKELAILRKVAAGALRPAFSETCPDKIQDIAMRCLEAEPEHRPTAKELVELVQGSATRVQEELKSTTTTTSTSDRNVNRRRASLQGRMRYE